MEVKKENQQKLKLVIFLNRFYKIIALLILALIGVLGYLVVVSSQLSQLKGQQTLLEEKKTELSEAELYSDKLKLLEKAIIDFLTKEQAALAKVEEVLPTKPQIPELIAQIDSLVKQSNFTLESLEITETVAEQQNALEQPLIAETELTSSQVGALPPGIKVLDIALNVSGGDYLAFKNVLIKNIERHVRILDITSYSFSVEAGASGAFLLNLKTYYYDKAAQS